VEAREQAWDRFLDARGVQEWSEKLRELDSEAFDLLLSRFQKSDKLLLCYSGPARELKISYEHAILYPNRFANNQISFSGIREALSDAMWMLVLGDEEGREAGAHTVLLASAMATATAAYFTQGIPLVLDEPPAKEAALRERWARADESYHERWTQNPFSEFRAASRELFELLQNLLDHFRRFRDGEPLAEREILAQVEGKPLLLHAYASTQIIHFARLREDRLKEKKLALESDRKRARQVLERLDSSQSLAGFVSALLNE
jgi:hypothetical protein